MNNVIDYLSDIVKRFPDKVAFSDSNGDVTFAELNEKAQKIAMEIIRKTDGKNNVPIAVVMKKSKECIIAFMGIVYSGNYYSPIDPSMPMERMDLIFETLEPALVVTNNGTTLNNIPQENQVFYEECMDNTYDAECIKRQVEQVLSVDPVYVLFTSGSTGRPKGVVISHASVIDYTEWLAKEFKFDEQTVFGNQAPFYFDNSILDIYSALKNGSRVYIIDEKLFTFPRQLMKCISDNKINTIFWVPSALIAVADSNVLEAEDIELPRLHKILFCGEVMPTKQMMVWRRKYKDALFANLYGPTEITDVCTYYVVDRDYKDDESLPIGKACKNTEILIINEENRKADIDEVGEICVRGIGVAKGYYRNKDKTAEAFVQNPLHQDYMDIVYKTGDLAKVNGEGNIIYIGRKDNQIKLQGHRIELGEIEAAAMSIEKVIRACAVFADVRKKIVLYVILQEEDINEKAIYKELKTKIPKYMLPSEIIIKDEMPLNVNGKIDRVRLKEMANEGNA